MFKNIKILFATKQSIYGDIKIVRLLKAEDKTVALKSANIQRFDLDIHSETFKSTTELIFQS